MSNVYSSYTLTWWYPVRNQSWQVFLSDLSWGDSSTAAPPHERFILLMGGKRKTPLLWLWIVSQRTGQTRSVLHDQSCLYPPCDSKVTLARSSLVLNSSVLSILRINNPPDVSLLDINISNKIHRYLRVLQRDCAADWHCAVMIDCDDWVYLAERWSRNSRGVVDRQVDRRRTFRRSQILCLRRKRGRGKERKYEERREKTREKWSSQTHQIHLADLNWMHTRYLISV